MKRILITGAHSYIGTSVEKWLTAKRFDGQYKVDTISLHGNAWRRYDFSGYDSVLHVAGIVHRKKVTKELYEKVNHYLVVDVAKLAVEGSVAQFIFLSTGAVYGQNNRYHRKMLIDEYSVCAPLTEYGKSKLKAENNIKKILSGTNTKLAIIRPPMVYGKGCKGNYRTLSNFAKVTPVFPKVDNERSMIYIENLCEFIRLLIEDASAGIFLPQNKEYVNTAELVEHIAKINGNRVHLTRIFDRYIEKISGWMDIVNKIFGDYQYKKITYFNNKYQMVGYERSIEITEGVT